MDKQQNNWNASNSKERQQSQDIHADDGQPSFSQHKLIQKAALKPQFVEGQEPSSNELMMRTSQSDTLLQQQQPPNLQLKQNLGMHMSREASQQQQLAAFSSTQLLQFQNDSAALLEGLQSQAATVRGMKEQMMTGMQSPLAAKGASQGVPQDLHTLKESPSNRITGNNLQQFQTNPRLVVLQMYETQRQQKLNNQQKHEAHRGQPNQTNSGHFKTMQEKDKQESQRRLVSNLSFSPTIRDRHAQNLYNLIPKIQSQDTISKMPQVVINDNSPNSTFWKGSHGGSFHSQGRNSNKSQLQMALEYNQPHNIGYASQTSFKQSLIVNKTAALANQQEKLKQVASFVNNGTATELAKGALGPFPSNTSLNGVGIKLAVRKPSPSKNRINLQIQANLSPSAVPCDQQSSGPLSLVNGWQSQIHFKPSKNRKSGGQSIGNDIEHMSGAVYQNNEGILNEFFDSKTLNAQSVVDLNNEMLGTAQSIVKDQENINNKTLPAPENPKGANRTSSIESKPNEDQQLDASSKMNEAHPSQNAPIESKKNSALAMVEDGIQSGQRNLSNQYEIANAKEIVAMNNTMSSLTGGAKEFKPNEKFVPSVSNGFKITDTNFMTMRDNRQFRLQRSILPEPTYENKDLSGPFKVADMNVTTNSKFVRRKLSQEKKTTMNISINLPVDLDGKSKNLMQAPLIIKNESIEIVTNQNKYQKSLKEKKEIKKDYLAHYDPLLVIPNDPEAAEESLAVNLAVNQQKEFKSLNNRFGHHRMSSGHILAQSAHKQSQQSINNQNVESAVNFAKLEQALNAQLKEQADKANMQDEVRKNTAYLPPSLTRRNSLAAKSDIFSKFNFTRQASMNNSRHDQSFILAQTLQSKFGHWNASQDVQDGAEISERRATQQLKERLLAAPFTVNKLEANVPVRQQKKPKKYVHSVTPVEKTADQPTEQPTEQRHEETKNIEPEQNIEQSKGGQSAIIVNNADPNQSIIIMDIDHREDTSPISTKYGAQLSQKRFRNFDSPEKRKAKDAQFHSPEQSRKSKNAQQILQQSFYSNKKHKRSRQNAASMSPQMRQWKMNKDLEQEFSQSTFEGQRHQILERSSISKLSHQNHEEIIDNNTLEQKFDSMKSSSHAKEDNQHESQIDDQSMLPMNQTFQKFHPKKNRASLVESQLSDLTQHKPSPHGTITDMKFQMQKITSRTGFYKKEGEKRMRDTSLSIFVIPKGNQIMPELQTPIPTKFMKFNMVKKNLSGMTNGKMPQIKPKKITVNPRISQTNNNRSSVNNSRLQNQQDKQVMKSNLRPDLKIDRNFNENGEHTQLMEDVYIDQNQEFGENDESEEEMGPTNYDDNQDAQNMSQADYKIVSQVSQPIIDDTFDARKQQTSPDEEVPEQIQNLHKQMKAQNKLDEQTPTLPQLQDFESHQDSTLFNQEQSFSPIRYQDTLSKHHLPSVQDHTNALSVIKEQFNKNDNGKSNLRLANQKTLKAVAIRDELSSIHGKKETTSLGLVTLSQSPDRSPVSNTNRPRELSLNEILFYTTQKMSFRGSDPSSALRRKDPNQKENNNDLKMSEHDLNKIQRVKNIKISFAHRDTSQVTQNFIVPVKTVETSNPFKIKREPSPEDIEMRRKLYGNSQSRDKLHKFMQEKSKKLEEIQIKDELTKAPLSINNINLNTLGHSLTTVAKQAKNREILQQMEQIKAQGLNAPSSMLHNNSRLLIQHNQQLNKQSKKKLSLEKHKKKFLRNLKMLNTQVDNNLASNASFNNLPEDISQTLKRNNIMLTTKSRSVLKNWNQLTTSKFNENATQDPKLTTAATIEPFHHQPFLSTSTLSHTVQARGTRSQNRVKNMKKSVLFESDKATPFMRTSKARINVLDMSFFKRKQSQNTTQHQSPSSNSKFEGPQQMMLRALNIDDKYYLKQDGHANKSHITIKEYNQQMKEQFGGESSLRESQHRRANSIIMTKANNDSTLALDNGSKNDEKVIQRQKRNSLGGFIHFPAKEKPSIMPAIFSNQTLQSKTSPTSLAVSQTSQQDQYIHNIYPNLVSNVQIKKGEKIQKELPLVRMKPGARTNKANKDASFLPKIL